MPDRVIKAKQKRAKVACVRYDRCFSELPSVEYLRTCTTYTAVVSYFMLRGAKTSCEALPHMSLTSQGDPRAVVS